MSDRCILPDSELLVDSSIPRSCLNFDLLQALALLIGYEDVGLVAALWPFSANLGLFLTTATFASIHST